MKILLHEKQTGRNICLELPTIRGAGPVAEGGKQGRDGAHQAELLTLSLLTRDCSGSWGHSLLFATRLKRGPRSLSQRPELSETD